MSETTLHDRTGARDLRGYWVGGRSEKPLRRAATSAAPPLGRRSWSPEPYTEDTWIAYDQNAQEIELEVVEDE